jgi:hypothetical protein
MVSETCGTLLGPLRSMSDTTMSESGEDFSDGESVGECSYAYEPYPFEQYDLEFAEYFKGLDLLHLNHMYLYDHGIVATEDFMPETVGEVYNKNLYCMSWFYDGCYPFDSWEENYENWLAEQAFLAMREAKFWSAL